MKLTVPGTASGIPVTHRKHAAALLEVPGGAMLFDAGEGITSSLLEIDPTLEFLSRIYISHTHPDHISGLPMLLQAMHLSPRRRPLFVVCDQRIHTWLLNTLRGMFLVPSEWSFEVHLVNLSFEGFEDGLDVDVRASETSHLERKHESGTDYGTPAVCYSFTVHAQNTTLYISSDIGSADDMLPHVERAEYALVEAAHISPEELRAMVSRTPSTRYIVTHIPPEMEAELPALENAFRAEFHGRVQFASDGYVYELQENALHG